MTFTITRAKMLAIVGVLALLIPAVAYASHDFNDVEDGHFYHDAASWAKTNAITLGCVADGSEFCGENPVTRGENTTFAHRYDTNVVQPALDDINDAIDDNADDILRIPILLWARVDEDGLLDSSSIVPGQVNIAFAASPGGYIVSFGEDVSDCAVTATLGEHDDTSPPTGYASFSHFSDTGIEVNTWSAGGVPQDSPFDLILVCPPELRFSLADPEGAIPLS